MQQSDKSSSIAAHADAANGAEPAEGLRASAGSLPMPIPEASPRRSPMQVSQGEQSPPHPPTFINHGLLRWEADRKEWLQPKPGAVPGSTECRSMHVDQVIDSMFSAPKNGVLPHAIALPQIIDLLTDLWEAEGLLD
ncbi:unnamed protein product [Chrysoparadoxa australica]